MSAESKITVDDAELLDLNEALHTLDSVSKQHKGDYITQVLRVVCRQLGDLILHMTKRRGDEQERIGGD